MVKAWDESAVGGHEHPATAEAELWSAYREALARRNQWVWAYRVLRSYTPTPFGNGTDWGFERTPGQNDL
jgi:hypothetical protein